MKHRSFYRVLGLIVFALSIALLLFCIKTEYRNFGDYAPNDSGITLCINEVMYANLGLYKDADGDNSDWIEIYNYGTDPVNLWGISLADHVGSDKRWYFPQYIMEPGEYLVVWASGKNTVTEDGQMHANFLINTSDTITLYYGYDCLDQFHVDVSVDPGVSVGRPLKQPRALAALSDATPGKANNAMAISYMTVEDKSIAAPEFSCESGIYDSEFYLSLSSEDPDATILYTLDGSEPDENSSIYRGPIFIHDRSDELGTISDVKTTTNYKMNYYWENDYSYKGTVVRARTMKNGVLSESVVTKSYFIDPDTDFTIVSLTVDPYEMFDEWDGLYVPGETFYIWKKYNKENSSNFFAPGNYSSDEKIKGHLGILGQEGTILADNNVEVKLVGAASRFNAAKGLKVTIDENKSSFDTSMFELIPESSTVTGAKGAESLVLRASGSDFNRRIVGDILAQALVADKLNLTYQGTQPAVMFINGEYWGITNIREAYGEDYFKRHYGIRPSNLDLINLNTGVKPYAPEIVSGTENDLQDYLNLVEYVKTHDLSDSENYKYVCDRVDVDNLIDYFIAQIYYGNDDWPGNNFRIWRANQQENEYGDNKWRFVFYDLDEAFKYTEFNSVEYVLKEDYDKEIVKDIDINFDDNRELIIALIQNPEFEEKFFERFEECLDTVFSTENVLSQIDNLQGIYDSEVPSHFLRWHTEDGWLKKIKNKIKYTYSEKNLYTYDRWLGRMDDMRDFATRRPEILREYIQEFKSN